MQDRAESPWSVGTSLRPPPSRTIPGFTGPWEAAKYSTRSSKKFVSEAAFAKTPAPAELERCQVLPDVLSDRESAKRILRAQSTAIKKRGIFCCTTGSQTSSHDVVSNNRIISVECDHTTLVCRPRLLKLVRVEIKCQICSSCRKKTCRRAGPNPPIHRR